MASRRHLIGLLIVAVGMLTGCGEEHKAKSTVNHFLKENLADPHMSQKFFSRLDSTKLISDSLVTVMQQAAKANPAFKKDVEFGTRSAGAKLMFIKLRYKNAQKDTVRQTFYLDNELENVVAVKEN